MRRLTGQKIVKLENRYSSEVLYTSEYDNIHYIDHNKFIVAFRKEKPDHKFYINKDSYKVVP